MATIRPPGSGPHFEAICRDYAITADPGVFGGLPGEVGSGVVPDPANRTQIEVDVVVLAPAEPGRPRKILSLGEAKWDRVMDLRHVERLRRARELLAVKGFHTRDTTLSCYSGAGFSRELQAARSHNIRLISLDQIYADSQTNPLGQTGTSLTYTSNKLISRAATALCPAWQWPAICESMPPAT